jgi:hypothetical protein
MLQTRNLILAVLSSVAVIVSTTSACNKEARVIVADVDGQIVYASDLEKSAGKALSAERERLYQLQKQKLEEYVKQTGRCLKLLAMTTLFPHRYYRIRQLALRQGIQSPKDLKLSMPVLVA